MIKIYKMRKGVETLLKEYKTLKGALDFIESEKNYDYILYAIQKSKVVAIQGKQIQKTFIEKMFDLLHIQ